MGRTHHTRAPQRRTGTRQTLSDTQNHSPQTEQRQADQWPVAGGSGQQVAQTTQKTAAEPHNDDALWPKQIRIAPGMRAAEQRGEILQADDQPRPECAKTHDVMDIARQHRQRQANRQITGEVKNHNGNNAQIEAQSAQRRFGGMLWHGV